MQKANLEMILKLLDEENIAKEVSLYHDMGREMFSVDRVFVQNFDELVRIGADFIKHQHNCTMSGKADIPDWMAKGTAIEIIDKIGKEDAYYKASRGVDGGLRAVIDEIYIELKKKQEEKFIRSVFYDYLDILDWEDKVRLMEQYLRKYGHNLSEQTRPKSAMELAHKAEDIIMLHMEALKQIRSRVGRV